MSLPSTSGRPRVLFVYQEPTSFVRDDLSMLGERYDVRPFAFGSRRGQFARTMVEQARWLREEVAHADLLYGWFADYHLALPVEAAHRHRVPAVVALGGYDCTRLPTLGYGVFASRWRAPLARRVARRATLLLPVADALMASENCFAAWPEALPQGLRAHVPGLKTPWLTIPTGYDSAAWPLGTMERSPTVCTVAFVDRERTFRLKGLDLLVEAARRLPDVAFDVVGVAPTFMPWIQAHVVPPENVAWLPPQPRDTLGVIYGKAAVYAQLSRSEGLPNALCEAMLCGCVPVVSAVGAMPEVVEGVGTSVEVPDSEVIADAMEQALSAPVSVRAAARRRIIERYPVERRRTTLFSALDGLLAG